jgi:rhodanese-related sulfurtransferase
MGPSTELELEPGEVAEWAADERAFDLVDVRERYEREAGWIEGSRHIPLAELPARVDDFDRERQIVFYCRVGSRSEMAAQAFRGAGFEAYSMGGGLVRWVAEERPISPADGYVASH